MNIQDRQIIGALVSEDETFGRGNVFVNSGSYIQYRVKSLLLPDTDTSLVSGFISSLDNEGDDEVIDDDYESDNERIRKFENAVKDKLFIYTYKVREDGLANMKRGTIINKPSLIEDNTYFYAIPVFCSCENIVAKEWENDKNWHLFRDYHNIDDFVDSLANKKPVGSTYGYYPDAFTPSFVIWKDENERLYAVGHVIDNRLNALGGLILECNEIFKIDITDYINFVVYDERLNPTLMYIPEMVYKKIEDELLKATVTDTSKETTTDLEVEEEVEDKIEKGKELIKPSTEELIEINTLEKSDQLIIETMDYHSQKRNLFYSQKDFVNIHTAIKCSSLVILSGLSGTGKSAIVDIYARALGINSSTNADENRLLFIPVRPSWNDDADLLGYVDLVHMVYRASDSGFVDFLVRAQQEENRNKLFLVCFDEMNLARVEHYFSQFLSILERPANQRELQLYDKQYSGRLYNSADYPCRIKIGDNIRFIGTVNVDESTYHFSDKVLDRANVIQLDVLSYADSWVKKKYGTLANITWTMDDYNGIIISNTESDMIDIQKLLWDIHLLLQSANSKYGVGPRIVKSIETYLKNLPKSEVGGFTYSDGVDMQIAQRVLTKVRGPENQLGEILAEKGENNFYCIFDKYNSLSNFDRCRKIVKQKKKELEAYGYCI